MPCNHPATALSLTSKLQVYMYLITGSDCCWVVLATLQTSSNCLVSNKLQAYVSCHMQKVIAITLLVSWLLLQPYYNLPTPALLQPCGILFYNAPCYGRKLKLADSDQSSTEAMNVMCGMLE